MSSNSHAAWLLLAAEREPGSVSAREIDDMLKHADGCSECAPRLRDFTALALVSQADQTPIDPERSAGLRARLLARATATQPNPRAAPRRKLGYAVVASSGWLAAAAMAVGLLGHHSFHEPLESGWLAAAVLGGAAVVVAGYARIQRRRILELEGGSETRIRPGPKVSACQEGASPHNPR